MMLTGHAINASNFYKRKSILLTLGIKECEVNAMLRDTYKEELKKSDDLLNRAFRILKLMIVIMLRDKRRSKFDSRFYK